MLTLEDFSLEESQSLSSVCEKKNVGDVKQLNHDAMVHPIYSYHGGGIQLVMMLKNKQTN